MVRALSLYEMTPSVPFNKTVVTHEALRDTEVAQRINDATMEADLDFVFLIPGHPMMRPDAGFIEFVSSFLFSPTANPSTPLFDSKS
jgi:hypothetical protein